MSDEPGAMNKYRRNQPYEEGTKETDRTNGTIICTGA